MPDAARTTVSTTAAVTFQQRPALLVMVVRVRAAAATLELGLVAVRRQSEDVVRRLTRLGAGRVWAGEVHADDRAETDPMARMHAAAALRRQQPGAAAERPGVNVAVAATWDITGRAAEEVLVLVDRLRFDAADPDPPAPPDDPPPWAGPAEQIQHALARAIEPAPDDRSPRFLYVGRPTDEARAAGAGGAYRLARQKAEWLARAAGLRLGGLASLHFVPSAADGRADRLMERQRCGALLASIGYELADGEDVSEDSRAAEVTISVFTTHHLEPLEDAQPAPGPATQRC